MTKKSGKSQKKVIPIPETLKSVVSDLIKDLTITFPEHYLLWSRYSNSELISSELRQLFEYFLEVFPQRFLDILYQNEEIFAENSDINTVFLPGIDFKLLYNSDDVTETTKTAIWKYLQLILLTITSSVKDKSKFGETANLFEGVDDDVLQSKLGETLKDISDFFGKISDNKESSCQEDFLFPEDFKEKFESIFGENKENHGEGYREKLDAIFSDIHNGSGSIPDKEKLESLFGTENAEQMDELIKNMFANNQPTTEGKPENESVPQQTNLPDPDSIHEHLKKLLDGKIGRLAKEMAEELSDDFQDLLKENGGNMNSSNPDIIKQILKNPMKMMGLVKKIGAKLTAKMQSGDISQEEMMKEASELFRQMKSGGGENSQFNEILKNMTKNMGSLGKNAKIDMNAMSRMEKQMSTKERMRKHVEEVRQKQANELLQKQSKLDPNIRIEKSGDEYKFSLGDEKQEKSVKPSSINETKTIDDIINKFDLKNEIIVSPTDNKKKKRKTKK
jgi:hypothetical protein